MPTSRFLILAILFCTTVSFCQPVILNPKLLVIAGDALSSSYALNNDFHIPASKPGVEIEKEVRFSDLLPKAKVARIMVSRYRFWYTDKDQGIRQVKDLLIDVEKNRLEGPIELARTTMPWTLDCRLNFVDGKSMRIVADYGLVAVEDSKGVWRVYRSLPAAYKKMNFAESNIVFAKGATALDTRSVPRFKARKAAPDERQRDTLNRIRSLTDLLDNQEVVRVVVTKYPSNIAEGPMRKAVAQLLSLEIEGARSSILWSEGNDWFLECRLELGINGLARLVTDGWHLYLEDTKGYGWFSRISPNEYIRGHERPQMLPRSP